MNKINLKGYVEKMPGDPTGVLSVCVATDDSQDRDGEVVDASGVDLTNFMKNPVLLWAHDYSEAPIGKVIEIVKQGNRILFKPQFAIDISEKAKQIYQMFVDGFLNAFSIGFMGYEKEGNVFTRTELLEISAVPVPSNANALVLARSAGIGEDLLDDMEFANVSKNQVIKDMKVKSVEIETLKTQIKELNEGLKPVEPDQNQDTRSKKGVEVALEAKRILQAVDKSVGEALRSLKTLQR